MRRELIAAFAGKDLARLGVSGNRGVGGVFPSFRDLYGVKMTVRLVSQGPGAQ